MCLVDFWQTVLNYWVKWLLKISWFIQMISCMWVFFKDCDNFIGPLKSLEK